MSLDAMNLMFLTLVVITCFYQAYYIWHSFFVSVDAPQSVRPLVAVDEPISLLIPLHNSEQTIGLCLESILANNLSCVSSCVVILDRCTDNSGAIVQSFSERFMEEKVPLKVASLPGSRSGKVSALLEGGAYITTRNVLLIDADIVFEPQAVDSLVSFHAQNGHLYSSPLIYPYQPDGSRSGIVNHLVCNNRLYRQGILQNVKNRYGVGNFPGGVQLVDYPAYIKLLEDGFVEDLVATYRLLAQGGKVAILPEVLAYEIERQTIVGLVLQRIRWTLGAIHNTICSLQTSRTRSDWNQKILISSYHVMWELQHYVIVLGFVVAVEAYIVRHEPGSYTMSAALLPFILYVVQIFRSAYLARKIYINSVIGLAAHCVCYPLVLTAALLCSCFTLLEKRKFYFRTQTLFRRDE